MVYFMYTLGKEPSAVPEGVQITQGLKKDQRLNPCGMHRPSGLSPGKIQCISACSFPLM